VTRAIGTLRRQIGEAEASRCPAQLSQLLLSLVNRGFANIGNPHNFCHPAHGAPRAIEDLVREVSAAIRLVCETPWSEASGFGPPQKEAFLEAATHAHGRAALCLSGGGAVALYHLGLVHELLRHGLLPSVISGTSGGSLTAGMLAVRTGEQMIASLYLPISPHISPPGAHRRGDDRLPRDGRGRRDRRLQRLHRAVEGQDAHPTSPHISPRLPIAARTLRADPARQVQPHARTQLPHPSAIPPS